MLQKIKDLSKFKKSILIYILFILLLMVLFISYVINSLYMYENNQPEAFVKNIIKEIRTSKESKYLDYSKIEINEYEDKGIKIEDNIKEILKDVKIEEKENNNFIITSNNIEIIEIVLEKKEHKTRLGILGFNLLAIKDIKLVNEKGIYSYKVTIPSTFKLEINGNMVDEKYIESKDNLDIYNNINSVYAPKMNNYKLDGFIKKPNIKVYNHLNDEVTFNQEGNKIESMDFFTTNDIDIALNKLVESIDIMKLAKDYSLFMTKDLGGTKNGFTKLEKYFIKDSDLYTLANDWATGEDIEFVSTHTLKNPTWTNEKLSNFKIYNDYAFSCLIHLEKNMLVNGKTKVDTMNDEWYFIYENGWKLVDMQYIKEN